MTIELIRGYPKVTRPFTQSPLECLIVEYNRNAKNTRENIDEIRRERNIKFLGAYTMKVNRKIVTNSVKEVIRIINTKE